MKNYYHGTSGNKIYNNSICLVKRTLTMFVGVVALRYQHHTTYCVVLITECHNSRKHRVLSLAMSETFYFYIFHAEITHNFQEFITVHLYLVKHFQSVIRNILQ